MEELHANLKKLQHTVQELLKRHSHLKKENAELKRLNESLSLQLSEQGKLINAAEDKMAANNLSTVFDENEKKILQSKIDAYLKEIEKCLDLLNV